MKKLISALIILGGFIATSSTYALSFSSDTIFLDANNKTDCEMLGGSFTERYGEIYCTISPSEILTTDEQKNISLVSTKIINIIGDNTDAYRSLQNILTTYETRFRENQDNRRLAMVLMLTREIEMSVGTPPVGCTLRYDGCNNCMISSDGDMACTEMYCDTKDVPYCIEY